MSAHISKKIFSFGELLWDILPGNEILGGAPFNFIYRIHSLGNSGHVVSSIGSDERGDAAYSRVSELGCDTSFLQRDSTHPTGTVCVYFDKNNHPDYYIVPHVAYDHIESTPRLLNALKEADCFCFGSLAQRCSHTRATLHRCIENVYNAVVFYDINLRKECYTEDIISWSLSHADICKLNETEVWDIIRMFNMSNKTIPDFCGDLIASYSLSHCVVTLGEYGVLGASHTGERVYIPGYKIRAVDSLGAGDAFSAGFIDRILQGDSLAGACEFGNILGAIVAMQQGATENISETDIQQFINSGYRRLYHNKIGTRDE